MLKATGEGLFDHFAGWRAAEPLRIAARRAEWERIERFDDSVDELFERCAPRTGLVGVRSARWLNWRYVDTPSRRQECYGIRRGGRLAGYVVCEWFGGHGFLVDLMAEDTDVQGALLAGFVIQSKMRGCEEATALVCEHHPAVVDLRVLGFRADRRRKPWRDVYPFIVRKCGLPPMGPAAAPPEADRDLGRWHLADGDRDAEHMSA